MSEFKLPRNAEQANALLWLALDGLRIIARLTENKFDDRAVEVLAAVRAVIATLSQGFEGGLTPSKVKKALTELSVNLKANDEAALAALKKKFNK